ncbi:MAG: hypothetical protein H6747_04610 [Deltaproteobacteria bacterium]|nr:hypothetical protein [Deltaproteobacteria bacterium]
MTSRLVGRTFLNPLLDYGLIGGGLSLLAAAIVLAWPDDAAKALFSFRGPQWGGVAAVSYFVLLGNSAHFAASTVRLYTKPGAQGALPFLSFAFPLVCLAVLGVCLAFPALAGSHLQSLYLTWSPYHYAAQAYGLAVMYCFRSGCIIDGRDKKLLWWAAMLPFFYVATFSGSGRTGIGWLLPMPLAEVAVVGPALALLQQTGERVLPVAAFVMPLWLFWRVGRSSKGPMPLISLLAILSNGVWWLILPDQDAFMLATVFHSIQYLVIIAIFHVKDQTDLADNRRSPAAHALLFYGACLALGYGLFHLLPHGFVAAGFGPVESFMLVAAAINLHHFIVDGFIWRLKKGDGNRRVVDEGAAPAEQPSLSAVPA